METICYELTNQKRHGLKARKARQTGDLPDNIASNTRLFADDCIVYRTIRDHADQEALQEDLVRLAEWEDKWGMEFHPRKCSTLSVTRSSSILRYPYQLKGHTLEVQDTTKNLGVDLQSTLSWKNHIDRITKKSNSMLGFLRPNLKLPASKPRQMPISAWSGQIWNTVHPCGTPARKS